MQFHMNGFKPGDPRVADPAPDLATRRSDTVDVLIIGCGPAGLTLAAQLAQFADIHTRIVEQKPGPLELGQADGVACRSIEMFEAFGFSERVIKEAYWVNETTFWSPSEGGITRTGRIQDVADDLSEMPHVILNQARVHDFFLDVMRASPNRLVPDYDRAFRALRIDPAQPYPVAVTLDHLGVSETVRARYLVGCDGARSDVRQAIGLSLRGEAANKAWGVMDVLVDTDFPDIRFKSVIKSAHGNVLVIPREGGFLVRLYVEMDTLTPGERVADRQITVQDLIAAAQRILRPYMFEVKAVAWWSVYEIGQRLCDRFDNGTDDGGPRVFIAGDACHTHSPKAGQGMNVSMGDAFNLGWKLASVLRGTGSDALLATYSAERQGVARDLIDFDRHWAQAFSGSGAQTPQDFQTYFEEHGRYTAGVAVRYAPSLITGNGAAQGLAAGYPVGMRFHSAPVIRLWDARPMQLGHVLKADGRWRLILLNDASDPTDRTARLWATCDALAAGALGSSGQGSDTQPDIRAVFQQPFRAIAAQHTHPLLTPRAGCHGLPDREKMFCADPAFDLFDRRGIDRDRGAMIVIRPDQYVVEVLALDDIEAARRCLQPVLSPA